MDVLLVEDNPSYAELTLRALGEISGGDLRVVVAATGEQAIEMLIDKRQHGMPRLVILDLKLPGIGGHEVLSRLRSNPGTRHLPVVVLSSSNLTADVTESYRRGAYGYVARPLNFKSYVDVLANIIAYWMVVNVAAAD